MSRFVSEAIEPAPGTFDPVTIARGEPSLPSEFRWHDECLGVRAVVRSWKSTKIDRGDAYVDKHWFEIELSDGRLAVVYFHRRARGKAPRWWLYSLE